MARGIFLPRELEHTDAATALMYELAAVFFYSLLVVMALVVLVIMIYGTYRLVRTTQNWRLRRRFRVAAHLFLTVTH